MKTSHIFGIAVISLITALTVNYFFNNGSTTAASQTVYDRVTTSGVMRCGYFEEAPYVIVDPNTGAKSGIAVELAEKIASELELKVEWVSTNFTTLTADLETGRIDAVCSSIFSLPRAGRLDYTVPYSYVPFYAFTQSGRTEFDGKLGSLDWSKLQIAGLDGEGATVVARKKLPHANFVILPQSSQIAELLVNVADKKADIAFVMPSVFRNFEAENPGRIQMIKSDKPFHVFNVVFGMKANEPAFKDMLDFMMRNLASSGYLQDLYSKYDPDGLLFRPAAAYSSAGK